MDGQIMTIKMDVFQSFVHHVNEVANKNSNALSVGGSSNNNRNSGAAIKISNRKIDADIERLSNQNDDSYYDDLMS